MATPTRWRGCSPYLRISGESMLQDRRFESDGAAVLPHQNRAIHLRGRYLPSRRGGLLPHRLRGDRLIGAGADVRARNRRGDGAASRRGGRDARFAQLGSACAGKDHRPSDRGRCRSERARSRRSDSAAQGRADPLRRRRKGADRWRCRSSTKNKSGSTALRLAQVNSGRGGSGSPEAKAEQQEILLLLEDAWRNASLARSNRRSGAMVRRVAATAHLLRGGDFVTSCAQAMKRSTTGLRVRCFKVPMAIRHGRSGRSTGSTFSPR